MCYEEDYEPYDHYGNHNPLQAEASSNERLLRNGTCNDQEPSREEWPATRTALPPDFKMAETWSSEIVNKGSQKAAAHPAFSPFVPVVSKSMLQTRMRKKGFFSIY